MERIVTVRHDLSPTMTEIITVPPPVQFVNTEAVQLSKR